MTTTKENPYTVTRPMFDHEGNAWTFDADAANPADPYDGDVRLALAPVGSRVEIVVNGHGPYNDDGWPDTERGAVRRHVMVGTLDRFDERMTDDGLYEKFAVLTECEPAGKYAETWVSLLNLGRPHVTDEGRLREGAFNHDEPDAMRYFAKGCRIVPVPNVAKMTDKELDAAILGDDDDLAELAAEESDKREQEIADGSAQGIPS